MNLKNNKLKLAVLLGLTVSCVGSITSVAFAETLNIVTQADYNSAKNAYGGIAPSNSLSNNTVTFGSTDGGTVPVCTYTNSNYARIYGGGYPGYETTSTSSADITNNTLIVNSGSNINYAMGGAWNIGTVTHNTAIINGGSIDQTIGGWIISGTADSNTLVINGGTINTLAAGGWSNTGEGNNNSVTVNAGTVNGILAGGKGSTIASDNTLVINGGTINATVMGGRGATQATDNTVTVNGGTINNWLAGGYSANGTANNNDVTINNGTITGNIYGGYSKTQASDNTVALNNGTIAGNIYGGYSTSSDKVTDNVVIIDPGSNLNISGAALYGSNVTHDQDSSGNQFGNTLDVYQKSITAKNVGNFSNINFYLPTSIQNGDTVLTLTSSNGTDVSYSNMNAYIPGSAKLTVGEKITLLTNANGVTSTNAKYSYSLTQGASLTYNVYMGQEGSDNIVLDLVGATVNPQTKSLVETRTANIGFLNSGMDMVDDVIPTIDKGTYVPFFIAKGDDMRYNTGSYVKTHGSHEMLGAARKITEKDGVAYLAPFIEAGWGWYDSHVDGIRADGDISYYGLGFLARRSYNNGFYYEGSLHYGKTESSYNSNDLSGVSNEYYDMKTPYYGINFEIGKTKQLNANAAFDIYGEYFYTRENGDSAVLSSGETYDFDSIASNRVRIGTRYTRQYGSGHELYAGAAYEYEFSGNASASYDGYVIPNSSLKGGSGMFELGYKIFTPTANVKRPVSLDLSLTGWVGKKEGVMPKVTARWYI